MSKCISVLTHAYFGTSYVRTWYIYDLNVAHHYEDCPPIAITGKVEFLGVVGALVDYPKQPFMLMIIPYIL